MSIIGYLGSKTEERKAKEKQQVAKQKEQEKQQVAKQKEQEQKKEQEKLPMNNTGQMYNHYLQNEVGANARFKGKRMNVHCVVEKVESTFGRACVVGGCWNVQLNIADSRGSYSYFPNKEEVSGLYPNDEILFEGRCDGMVLGSLTFSDCKMLGTLPKGWRDMKQEDVIKAMKAMKK